MLVIAEEDYLTHHGVKGMKWGVRHDRKNKGRKKDLSFAKESRKTIKTNVDGSKTIPKGFVFNRVGKSSIDVNAAGGLYVSHGKQDAARYIKSLGPTPLRKILNLSSAEVVQHISVKEPLKVSSDKSFIVETSKLLLSNKDLLKSFNESFYRLAAGYEKEIGIKDIEEIVKNPNTKSAHKLAYGIGSMLGDPSYAKQSKNIYDCFRSKGYDAVPDLRDIWSGTSETAMIIINPSKVEMTSKTVITKDVMKKSKNYVKGLEKLKVSEMIN